MNFTSQDATDSVKISFGSGKIISQKNFVCFWPSITIATTVILDILWNDRICLFCEIASYAFIKRNMTDS